MCQQGCGNPASELFKGRYRCQTCAQAIRDANGRRTEARTVKPNDTQQRWAWDRDSVPASVTEGAAAERQYVPPVNERFEEYLRTFRSIRSLYED